ncbi:hypothetical protein, variant [Capsaspora owczarzaki ATCC 30864]|uniref:Uncharacterized protein n=2 Tax=Capsaspora owczarzaki (strain ATCC 30864) TaxID=595528 RepID=A0A0D2U5H5_CAPO3|nr:hypothetical protein CAOG_001713 [Capsaspora owczarzaki ATCC 30864]KJE90397.1 hypothetical protein, variant [Capsaspora owczarzaki ATCC 30864]
MMKRSEATLVGALSTPALRRQFPRFERTSVENSFYRLAEINHETNVTFSDVLAREAERHEAAVETGKPSLRRLICHALPSFKFCRTEVAWPSPVADSRRNQGSESDEQALANSRPHSSRRLPVLVQPESAPLLSRYVMSSLAWSAGARLVHTATFVAFSAAYRLEVSPLTAFLPVDSAPFVTSVEFGHKVEIAVQIHAPLSTLLASLPAWTLVVPDLPEYSANAASRGRAMSPDEILVDVLTRSLSRDADALEQFSLLCQGCDVSANLSFVAWNDKKQPTNKLDTCQAYLASSGGDLQRLAEMPVSLATMGRQTACAVAVSDVSLADLATYVQLLLHSSQSQRKQLPAQVISVTVAETRDSGLLVSTLAVSTTTCMLGGLGSPRSLISNMFFHNLLASFNVLLLGFVLYLFGGYLLAQLARTSTRVRGILAPRGASVIQVIPAMPTFYFITLRPLSRFFSQLFDGSAPTNLEDAERRQRARVEMERRNQPQAHVNPLEVLVRDPAILVHAAVVADVAVEAPSIDNGAVSANSGTTNELPESNAAPRNDNDATSHNETASVLESDVVAVAPAAEHALQVSEADPRSLPSNRSNPPDSPALAIIRHYGPSLTPRQRPQSPQDLELD